MITHRSRQVFNVLDLVIIVAVALMVLSATLVKGSGLARERAPTSIEPAGSAIAQTVSERITEAVTDP